MNLSDGAPRAVLVTLSYFLLIPVDISSLDYSSDFLEPQDLNIIYSDNLELDTLAIGTLAPRHFGAGHLGL